MKKSKDFFMPTLLIILGIVVLLSFSAMMLVTKDGCPECVCASVGGGNIVGSVYGTGLDLRTHMYTGYDVFDRVAHFAQYRNGSGSNVSIAINDKNIGWLVYQGIPYKIKVLNRNDSQSKVLVDVTGDKVMEIARKPGQSFAVINDGVEMSFVYNDYDYSDQVVTLHFIDSNARLQVAVDDAGRGNIVYRGQTFALRVLKPTKDDSPLKVDIDGEGSLDIKVLEDQAFPLFAEEQLNGYAYERYDVSERTLTFKRLSDGLKLEYVVQPLEGHSTFVQQGVQYPIHVRPGWDVLDIDTDGDGFVDTVIEEDDIFILE